MERAIFLSVIFIIFNIIPASISEDACSPPTAWVVGTHKDSGEQKKFEFKSDSTSEFVLRDLKDVSVHCEAEYSVEIIFDGYADFRFLAAGSGSSSKSVNNGSVTVMVQKHTTYVHLVSLKEGYTGLYRCRGRGSQTKNSSIAAYIFVPTNQLFVSPRVPLLSSTGEGQLVVPCPVAEPDAVVKLVKLQNEDTISNVPAKFDPRQGFLVDRSSVSEGTLFCIAKHNGTVRAVEFSVVNGPVDCDRKCGENSQCVMVNEQKACQCKSGYEQTLVSEKCFKVCGTDTDCPKGMACLHQEQDSFLLDLLSGSSWRRSGDNGRKDGACRNPCVFTDAKCTESESCRVVDSKATCVSA